MSYKSQNLGFLSYGSHQNSCVRLTEYTRTVVHSRNYIELLRRLDGAPLQPEEIKDTVYPTPLSANTHLSESSSLILTDLGLSYSFKACKTKQSYNNSDFRPPKLLLGLPCTHKADIFSLGLLFWEIVMLRRLIETHFVSTANDPERTYGKNRALGDLAQRLGPIPESLRCEWEEWEKWVDERGVARDMQEEDGEVYEEGQFELGDIWDQARQRRPLDMGDLEMGIFVGMILKMLAWEAADRPLTAELRDHEWFRGLQ